MRTQRRTFFLIGSLLALAAHLTVNFAGDALHAALHDLTGEPHAAAEFAPATTTLGASRDDDPRPCDILERLRVLRGAPQRPEANRVPDRSVSPLSRVVGRALDGYPQRLSPLNTGPRAPPAAA